MRLFVLLALPFLTAACEGADFNEPCNSDVDCKLQYVCYIETAGDPGVCWDAEMVPGSSDTDA